MRVENVRFRAILFGASLTLACEFTFPCVGRARRAPAPIPPSAWLALILLRLVGTNLNPHPVLTRLARLAHLVRVARLARVTPLVPLDSS